MSLAESSFGEPHGGHVLTDQCTTRRRCTTEPRSPGRNRISHRLGNPVRSDAHDSVERFARSFPSVYLRGETRDRYVGSIRYEVETLFRALVSKELHELEHQTALLEYLDSYSELRERLGFETVPDQSIPWYGRRALHRSAWDHRDGHTDDSDRSTERGGFSSAKSGPEALSTRRR